MKPLTTDQIRAGFLEFFAERGHEVVASSPLVPANDPTLLFTNAGMVQFKDVFTGKEKRGYTAATTSQKCVRAGGKHNDLENVGYTPRHHTFFEMLGNFSFGEYFKKAAIEYAWELITKVWNLPVDRLCVTVFEGDDDVPADDEAAALWAAVGVPEDRILRLGRADNYWQMGDTGPQGPCSEIHYCTLDEVVVEKGAVERSEGWLEIWNLVFMQFVRETADGPIEKLPRPCVDTGAGLERLAMVMQGDTSTYETDGFRALIDAIAERASKTYGGTGEADDVSLRVIADHARATTFLVADGVQPSNEGRGYVLRRIMRRAIRHGSRLGFDELFFDWACERVIDRMVGAYPQLESARSLVQRVAQSEETSFRRTLDQGLRLLNKEIEGAPEGSSLDPEFVARLYHTHGFPIDLTRVIANERSLQVDEAAAHDAVKASNPEQAKASLGVDSAVDKVWFEVREEVGGTEFFGYDRDDIEATVAALVVDGHRVTSVGEGVEVAIVLDRTPFYGESGGQVGDRGILEHKGLRVDVSGTTKPRPDLHVHHGVVAEGTLEVGRPVEAKVDARARDATRKNHSATHLIHLALKEVLGDHVQQKGSLVAPDRLRFDYAHFEPVTSEQSAAIEQRVNEMVLADARAETQERTLDEARAAGAVMLFGEKYDETVRMVQIADSLELCGGTHVSRSGEIGMVKLVSDAAIASGVRRLEAVTGLGALRWVQDRAALIDQAAAFAKTGPEGLPERVDKLVRRTKELERDLEKARAEAALASKSSGDVLDQAEDINGIRVLVHRADGTPSKALRGVSDKLRDRLQSGVVVLGACDGDKAALIVAATKDLTDRVHAGKVVKAATEAMEGRGGGRPDFAQGGGKASLLDAGFARAREVLQGV